MIPHAAILRDLSTFIGEGALDVDQALDLTEASLQEDDPVLEKSRLATRGFVHGRTVRWVNNTTPNGQVLSLTVHQLGSPREATLSVADHRESFRAAACTVEQASQSLVWAHIIDAEEDDEMLFHSEAIGPYQLTLVTSAQPGAFTRDVINSIAGAQESLLRPLL